MIKKPLISLHLLIFYVKLNCRFYYLIRKKDASKKNEKLLASEDILTGRASINFARLKSVTKQRNDVRKKLRGRTKEISESKEKMLHVNSLNFEKIQLEK